MRECNGSGSDGRPVGTPGLAAPGDAVGPRPAEAVPSVVGVVLAAGAGTRFGGPKILAEQGRWADVAVAALDTGGCDEVLVAMGAAVVEPPYPAAALMVPDWADGLAATVRTVLAALADRSVAGIVLHVVDMPDVGARVVKRVIAAAAARPERLARAVYRGRPGHPVYIGADHFEALTGDLDGDVGAATYLRRRTEEVIEVECGDLASGADRDAR